MAFLRNSIVNLLNLHFGIHMLAVSAGGAFVGVYLLRAGVPIAGVLGAYALITGLRFLIRPFVLGLGKRFGLKPLVIAGAAISALQYPPLAFVHGLDLALLGMCAIAAIGDTLYWTAYHAYFAALGDADHRGKQISAREAMSALVGIVAPIIGGWTLATLGPLPAFGAVAIVQLLSALPLLSTPNVPVVAEAPGSMRSAFSGMTLFAADGWFQGCAGFVWDIALFVTLKQSFTAFGGAMALAAIVGALCGLLLGGLIDNGGGKRAVLITALALTAVVGLRAISVGSPALALTANALGALTARLYVPTLMTAVYNLAQSSPCVLRFSIATEGAWDVGCSLGCLTAAGLITLGAPLGPTMLLALAGVACSAFVMRRYYHGRAITPLDAQLSESSAPLA